MTKESMISASVLILLSVTAAKAGPCTDEINNVTKILASRDAGSGSTVGAAPAPRTSGQASTAAPQQHPPTATMSKETEGRAASPQDVQRQTTGQPTAAERSQQSTSSTEQQTASEALARARELDQQGKEVDCMSAVQRAKQLSRSQ